MSKKTYTDFTGTWHIYEMELWDEKYFNMEVQAYIEIEENGMGQFQFGLVDCSIDGEISDSGKFEFTFDGSDECDETSGRGWIKIKDKDTIEGCFKFHQGDRSKFMAKKAEE